jgi:hypothetical protein
MASPVKRFFALFRNWHTQFLDTCWRHPRYSAKSRVDREKLPLFRAILPFIFSFLNTAQ